MKPLLLGVNIDHIATLRQVRGTPYPSVLDAAMAAEAAGADAITVHLREDRRHIQDSDVEQLAGLVRTRLNLEVAVTGPMLEIARTVNPADVCLVPERREELTTEGGLDVVAAPARVRDACSMLSASGIRVSLFIDPESAQVEAAAEAGAPVVELHTGAFADAPRERRQAELDRVRTAARRGVELGLTVNAGHGLHYENVVTIAVIPELSELNIGHAIVARAVFTGLDAAVREMKTLMVEARA